MMTRKELVESPEYITTVLQIQLYDMVRNYLKDNNLTQAQFAKKLGVSKGYISQVLNCRYDSRLSNLVKLALACGMMPDIEYRPIAEAEMIDERKQFGGEKKQNIVIRPTSVVDSNLTIYRKVISETLAVDDMNSEEIYKEAV